MTDVRITPARQRVLEILKLEEPATAADLAAALGLTEAAVRQHLAVLETEGIVTANASAAERPGRPAARWSLTDDGRRQFPDRHGELTVQLVDAIRDALGDDGLTRVIDARTDEQLRTYRAALRGAQSLQARVVALAAQRSAEGYIAEVVHDDDGYLLIEHHCPICDAAKSCLGFCHAELRLFGEALGDDVTVERTEHLLAGGRRCTYRVRPR